MSRTGGEKTKEKLVFLAFLLFSKKPYCEVIFKDLEELSGLTRGALLYHFKNKQELFNLVVEFSMLSRASILEIPLKERDCLKNFLLDFLNKCEVTVKTMARHGIKNVNLAHYNIENQALYYFENYDKLAKQMQETELKVWEQAVKKAYQNKEIKQDIVPERITSLLYYTYLGHAYSSAKEAKGCNMKLLKEELFSIYDMVKENNITIREAGR
jgi:AcrR family transcriptional regulator